MSNTKTTNSFNIEELENIIDSFDDIFDYDDEDEEVSDRQRGKIYEQFHNWLEQNKDKIVEILQSQENIKERLELIRQLNKIKELYNQLHDRETEMPINSAIQNQLVDISSRIIRGQFVSNEELSFYCQYQANKNIENFDNLFNYEKFLTREEKQLNFDLGAYDEAILLINSIGTTIPVSEAIKFNHPLLKEYSSRLYAEYIRISNKQHREWEERKRQWRDQYRRGSEPDVPIDAEYSAEFREVLDKLSKEYAEKIKAIKQSVIDNNKETYDRIQSAKERANQLRETFGRSQYEQLMSNPLSDKKRRQMLNSIEMMMSELGQQIDFSTLGQDMLNLYQDVLGNMIRDQDL